MVNKQYSTTDLEAFMKIAANWQNSNHILEGVDIKGEMQPYMNNPAINMYKKRERTQNWNHQEKKFLLDLCRKDMRIIENKRLDAGLTAVKNKAWKIIHLKFSNAFGTDRTCNRLKEQWRRMKACTRNEIMDYNNRLSRFGTEIADRKKPSSFTFEVWEFMQEAKKACKSEALDGVDYSKMPLALEEDFEYREDEHNHDDDNDMEDSRTPPQELCDIDIKEETTDDQYNDSLANGNDRLSVSPNRSHAGQQHSNEHEFIEHGSIHSPGIVADGQNGFHHHQHNPNDQMNFTPAFNMNNISATLEALNALRTGQFPAAAAAVALQSNFAAAQAQAQQAQADSQLPPPAKRQRTSSGSACGLGDQLDSSSSCTVPPPPPSSLATVAGGGEITPSTTPELQAFMDMQSKEHFLRMKILEVQLQAAKYNRDIVEINKTIALQKLQEFARKRMS